MRTNVFAGRTWMNGVLIALVVAASCAAAGETILYREDFNAYAPGGSLIKDAKWQTGAPTDDVYFAAGGPGGAKDLYLDGSTNLSEEKGGTAVPYFSRALDRLADPTGGGCVVLEADLRAGAGADPASQTSNCDLWLVDAAGGYSGIVGRWARTYVDGEPRWRFTVSETIAIAGEGVDALAPVEKPGEWAHVGIVVDTRVHTVQGFIEAGGERRLTRAFEIYAKFKASEVASVVIREDNRNSKAALDVDNIVVRQTGENPIPEAQRGPVVGAPSGPPAGAVAPAGAAAQAKWLEPTDEVVSEHVAWARPDAGGPLRVLFIVPRTTMREVVEICERFDVEREVFALSGLDGIGNTDKTTQEVLPGVDPASSSARLRDQLAKEYDCIVLGNVTWASLPKWAQAAIVDKVKAGMGLVERVPQGTGSPMDAQETRIETDGKDVLGAFPYEALPAFRAWPDFAGFFSNTVLLSQLGKGRIARLVNLESDEEQLSFITPEIVDAYPAFSPIHYDYYLAMVGKLLAWSAGRTPAARVVEPEVGSEQADRLATDWPAFAVASEKGGDFEAAFALRTDDWGKVVAVHKRRVTLEPGQSRVAFKIAPAPAGGYFADLWLRRDGRTVCFGSKHVTVRSASAIRRLATSQPSYTVGSPIRVEAEVSGARKGLVLEVQQRDAHGRLVARTSTKLAGETGAETVALEWTPPAPLSVIQFLATRLLDGDEVLAEARTPLLYRDLAPDRRDVRWVTYQGHHGSSYLDLLLARELRRAGFDTWMDEGGWTVKPYQVLMGTPFEKAARRLVSIDEKRTFAVSGLLNDLFFIPSVYRSIETEYGGAVEPRGYATLPTEFGLARRPCITNPGYIERCRQVYQEAARKWRDWSIPEYNLGDECALVNQNRDDKDVCFSDTCVRDFQEYVRGQYGTIEALNKEYGTPYASFEEVIPVPLERVKDRQQIPVWIDHRRHMENVWASYFDNARRFIREVDPQAKVGYEGSDEPGHVYSEKVGGGENYYKLAHAMDLNATYYYPMQLDCVRDWSPSGAHIGGGWYGGYPAIWRAGRDALHHRWWLWNTLLRGANAFWVYEATGFPHYDPIFSVVAPDFSLYDFFEADVEEMRVIKGGVGKLFVTSVRPNDGIAVLYSTPSMFLTTFTEGLPTRWDSASAAPFLLTEAGFQYRMLSDEELGAGLLNQGAFRALYLPYCQAISPKGVEEILRFAEGGGTVIADLRPAVADDHGKPYPGGALDALFGVKQATDAPRAVKASAHLAHAFGKVTGDLPEARADASLALAGGEALAEAGGAPAVVVHDQGKGKAVLFNVAASDWMDGNLVYAPRFADNAKAETARELMRAALGRSGITPEVTVAPEVPGCHVWRFRAGDAVVMGVLWDAPGFLPGMTWNEERQLDAFATRESRTVRVALGADRHVFDVLAGKSLGLTREIECTLRPGFVHLFAALPEAPSGVVIQPERPEVAQGEEVACSITLAGAGAIRTVFRVEFIDPNDNETAYYRTNVEAPNGKARASRTLALDEKTGDWTIRATDILTGATAEAGFRVTPPPAK